MSHRRFSHRQVFSAPVSGGLSFYRRIHGGIMQRRIGIVVFLSVLLGFGIQAWAQSPFHGAVVSQPPATADDSGDAAGLPEAYTTAQVDEILSRMSDERVRQLLIEELKRDAEAASEETDGVITDSFGQVESGTDLIHRRVEAFLLNVPKLPEHLNGAIYLLTEGKGIRKVWIISAYLVGILIAAWFCELLFRRLTVNFRERLTAVPTIDGVMKFWGALLRIISDGLGVVVFALACLAFFLALQGQNDDTARMMFVGCLAMILMVRVVALISHAVCSPTIARLRLLALADGPARSLHRAMMLSSGMIAVGLVAMAILNRIGVQSDTVLFIVFVIGTLLIFSMVVMVWRNRSVVAVMIMGRRSDARVSVSWVKSQFAAIWHVLATAYLLIVWLLWIFRLILSPSAPRGAFIISLLIVPIYLLLDYIGQWIVRAVIGTLPRQNDAAAEITKDGEEENSHRYFSGAATAVRVVIIGMLGLWMAGLWGMELPYGRELVNAVFDILVTLLLALLMWRAISRLIEKKLAESAPDVSEAEEDAGEWGAAATAGRSYTLLPLIRKFVGVTIAVMATLTVLSSIGVEIAPLLAGAGVIGLAIGFGAQKLVSDVLSGIFFLMDDAFRIGEYIQAGGVSGMVEDITMRNVKLRHHRGMLQLVPFSDLGAVTNFMRGGMVVKFNIQLPYDTDIDKVRKIIKKVGKKMLEDEELGPDFIQPVKSQGVREVGDSVMTFRVKFTAKPGKHFVIRREAMRRITAALAEKGIHYAHRKVIVDMPEELKAFMGDKEPGTESGNGTTGEMDARAAVKMGAGAAVDTIVRREAERTAGEEKKT